jgi:hypothetical protein
VRRRQIHHTARRRAAAAGHSRRAPNCRNRCRGLSAPLWR